jgi:hypothetical protein
MLEFYQDLGFNYFKTETESGSYIDKLVGLEGASIKITKLRYDDNFIIELLKYSKPFSQKTINHKANRIGISHIAVDVKSIINTVALIKKSGGHIIGEIQTSPDKKVKVVYAKDIENNIIELVEIL